MIYLTAFLLGVALFNRSAISYALVLIVVTTAYRVFWGRYDLYPHIDAASFWLLAALAYNRPTWWGVTTAVCALVSVGFQMVYWLFYANGFYVEGLFRNVQTGVFLIAVMALLWGSYDVNQRMGSLLARLRRSSVGVSGSVWAGRGSDQAKKEAP